MTNSPYNNPMLAQGLSSLVQSFIGNPQAEAQSLEAASRARLNSQTAQFRDAIGDTGLSGDLASMMIRALQAGPEYSGNAPEIGNATIRMGAMGFGGPQHTPSPAIVDLILGGARRGGGGGGGGGGGSAPSATTPRPMVASDLTNMRTLAEQSGIAPEVFSAAVLENLESGEFRSAADAMADVMARVGDVPGEPVEPGWIAGLFGAEPTIPTTRGIRPRTPAAPAPGQATGPTRLRYNVETGELE